VLHTHTRAINGVGATREGLLPLTQKALTIMHFVRYHDFEGAALGLDERESIVRDLGSDGRAVILRNHGALTAGSSVAEAWVWHYRLEMACRFQIDAMICAAGGMQLQTLSQETIDKTVEQGRRVLSPGGFMSAGETEWPSLIRKLERERGTYYRT
jgi:ribulose-5-phosphate 4-epimerase/fuculose-1-phosphate aldolase